MIRARDIINKKYDKPESKYGATRSTLFGKFYERIIAKWIEEKEDYKLKRHENFSVHKPRIYWNTISLEGFNFTNNNIKDNFVMTKEEIEKPLENLKKRSHCTPDGVFEKESKYYIWEAKNWPLTPEKGGPKKQIKNYLCSNPWIFARKFSLDRPGLHISRFIFSWWDMEIPDKEYIEKYINTILGENKFSIMLTEGILTDCIKNNYPWYRDIIGEEKKNIEEFFNQLLGS